MSRLLLVDDEEMIRNFVRKYAEFEGYEVTEAENGQKAVELCRRNTFDLILMDIMMPELDGFSACREIRRFAATPIIMLTARGEEYDKINAFELGIDDYVVKPFSPKELMLRIRAVLARTAPAAQAARDDIFTSGGLCVNFRSRKVTVDGTPVDLTPKEYDLLFYLVRNRGIALSREKLITEVWGYDFFGGDRTLDTHIKLLRKSLGTCASHIVTLRGMGYRFDG